MRVRWRMVLPVVGLVLFAGVTYDSLRLNSEIRHPPGQYFYWSFIRLDSDPNPCKGGNAECISWDHPYEARIEPGPLTLLLTLPAFPAFVVGIVIVHGVWRLGISEVTSFFVSMPLLISAWYYFIGWLVDRWRDRRQLALTAPRAGNT